MKGRYIVGVDVGTTKICAVVAQVNKGGLELIASGTVPSSGMRKGVVIDIEETANSIKMAVKEAESVSGVEIKAAYIGIAGSHMKCIESYGVTGIREKEVTEKDIDRVMDAASAVYVPLDREIVHVLPAEFFLDGQDGITRPLGMSGMRLEAKVQIVTASQPMLENLERALSRAGLKVVRMVFQPVASAMAVLKEEELQNGALIIDFGGGTTDIALYKGGTLRAAAVIPVGGLHFTNDIGVGLKLPQKEAEALKRRYGAGADISEESVETRNMSGKPVRVMPGELAPIIKYRCEELLELVKQETAAACVKYPPLCAVITGGGSLLKGMVEITEKWLSLPVRQGVPERIKSPFLKDVMREPQYATAVGLLYYALAEEGLGQSGSLFGFVPGLIESLKEKMMSRGISRIFAAGAGE
jgi:cell division protein FtsA